MSINIPSSILDLRGQCVNTILSSSTNNTLTIICRRDKRFSPKIEEPNKKPATVNRYVRRMIYDLPLFRCRVEIEIELAQVVTKR